MLKKMCLILMLVLFVPTLASTQTQVTLTGVAKAWLRSSGPIIKDDAITGYYFFYRVDEKSKKTKVYMLEILDQNLNKVASKKITGTASLQLQESAFNGEKLMFKFYDAREKEISYRIYDKNAEFVTKKSREVTKMFAVAANSGAGTDDEGQVNKTLFAIPDAGFVSYSAKKDKKMGYTVEYFSDEKGQKGWKHDSNPTSKENKGISLLALDENVILNIVGKSPGAFSKKIRYSLLALDAKTGKEKFEVDIKDDEYTTILMNGNINPETGNILLFGEYYPIDARPMKDPSLGLFSYTMDMEGNIIDKKYTSWVDDVSKFVEVNEKGKEKGKGFTFFHKIIQAKDGRIFAIGEQFRKSVSEVGVALAVLGGSNSNVALLKMVIDDMVIYEFSPEFELKNVRVIEKDKTDINLPQGMGIVNSQVLARYIESLGMFDYSFTQMRDEGENFTIVYIDYKRLKGEKDKFMLEALSYEGGEFVEDAIDLTPEKKSTSRTVFPGKPGYIVVSEYFRKDKTIVSRLEKINF